MKTSQKATIATAAVLAVATPFLIEWEGTDLKAVRDPIGTGHPITYCHGQTAEFGRVKPGQRFTPAQCDELLAKSLPTYLRPLQACIERDVPVKVMAALLDAAYNAGPSAVCHSPMVAKANAGDIEGACQAFVGWYVRSSGLVRTGLQNRRKGEAALCRESLIKPLPPIREPLPWWQRWARNILMMNEDPNA